MRDLLTILIIGFDGYSDLWNDCIRLIKKFWKGCPYNILFVNNVADCKWDGVTVLHAGEDAEWSRKVILGMKNIETEFVCLLLEDFLFGGDVDTDDINNLLLSAQKNHIDYVKLVDMNSVLKPFNKHLKGNRHIQLVRYSDDYGISLQPSIWRREFLEKKVGSGNYNAWSFEFNRVKESQPLNRNYMANAWFDIRNVLHIQHGVIQGKYLPSTIRYFKKKGIVLNVQREVMKNSEYRKLRLVSLLKTLTPLRMRPIVKRFLEKKGVVFVSTNRGE